jgi:hypothetical protein
VPGAGRQHGCRLDGGELHVVRVEIQ